MKIGPLPAANKDYVTAPAQWGQELVRVLREQPMNSLERFEFKVLPIRPDRLQEAAS